MAHRNGHRQEQQRGRVERGTRAEERYVEARDRGYTGGREDERLGREAYYGHEGTPGRGHYGEGGYGRHPEQGYYGQGRPMYGDEDRGPSYGGRGSDERWHDEGGLGYGAYAPGRFDRGEGGFRSESRYGQSFYGEGLGGPREGSASRGRHYGKTPQGYARSDERIREDVCDRLMQGHVDPSQITVRVQNGEVTLEGKVERREDKYRVEDIAEGVLGVKDVENRLKVAPYGSREQASEAEEKQQGEKRVTRSTSRGHSA